jgi:hypothetical protein
VAAVTAERCRIWTGRLWFCSCRVSQAIESKYRNPLGLLLLAHTHTPMCVLLYLQAAPSTPWVTCAASLAAASSAWLTSTSLRMQGHQL